MVIKTIRIVIFLVPSVILCTISAPANIFRINNSTMISHNKTILTVVLEEEAICWSVYNEIYENNAALLTKMIGNEDKVKLSVADKDLMDVKD